MGINPREPLEKQSATSRPAPRAPGVGGARGCIYRAARILA
jgi:hypothetical protein